MLRGGPGMRSALRTFAITALATTALGSAALAQASYPCANDLPNPYKLVTDWAQMPRAFAPVNAVTVDAKNNFWAADRCEEEGCKSVFEIGPDGKTLKNIGAGLFVEPHAKAVDSRDRLFVGDRSNNRVDVFDRDGKFIAAWKQFGRPSGLYVDKDDMLYVIDSQSTDEKGDRNNPNCKRGIRVGSAKDGKVMYYIPPPVPKDPKWQPPIGVTADRNGNIYAASDDQMDVKKYVKN